LKGKKKGEDRPNFSLKGEEGAIPSLWRGREEKRVRY